MRLLAQLFVDPFLPPLQQAASSSRREKDVRKYVRGEENLGDWRPRSSSLIEEHQEQLCNHKQLAQFESLKQDYVLLRDMYKGQPPPSRPPMTSERATALLKTAVESWTHGPLERHLSEPPETPLSQRSETNLEPGMCALEDAS